MKVILVASKVTTLRGHRQIHVLPRTRGGGVSGMRSLGNDLNGVVLCSIGIRKDAARLRVRRGKVVTHAERNQLKSNSRRPCALTQGCT